MLITHISHCKIDVSVARHVDETKRFRKYIGHHGCIIPEGAAPPCAKHQDIRSQRIGGTEHHVSPLAHTGWDFTQARRHIGGHRFRMDGSSGEYIGVPWLFEELTCVQPKKRYLGCYDDGIVIEWIRVVPWVVVPFIGLKCIDQGRRARQ